MTKRFYKTAQVGHTDDGFIVKLDGAPIKTPSVNPMAIPYRSLAQAVADEWQGQGDKVDPKSMPLTGLVNTAIDRTPTDRAAMTIAVLRHAETDLLCYRAETPADLVRLQQQTWQPLLDWSAEQFDAQLIITNGILPVSQPPAALAALESALDNFNDLEFTALATLCAACGSLIVALALAHGHIDGDQAFVVAELDHDYQVQTWGADDEAVARQRTLKSDIANTMTILTAAKR